MVTPDFCPRLFEALTALTHAELRVEFTQCQKGIRDHRKKKEGKLFACDRRTQPKLEVIVAWKKTRSHVRGGSPKKKSVIVHE